MNDYTDIEDSYTDDGFPKGYPLVEDELWLCAIHSLVHKHQQCCLVFDDPPEPEDYAAFTDWIGGTK